MRHRRLRISASREMAKSESYRIFSSPFMKMKRRLMRCARKLCLSPPADLPAWREEGTARRGRWRRLRLALDEGDEEKEGAGSLSKWLFSKYRWLQRRKLGRYLCRRGR
jgi:hypothetical protein